MIRYTILISVCCMIGFLHADKKKLSKLELDRIIDERVLFTPNVSVCHTFDLTDKMLQIPILLKATSRSPMTPRVMIFSKMNAPSNFHIQPLPHKSFHALSRI